MNYTFKYYSEKYSKELEVDLDVLISIGHEYDTPLGPSPTLALIEGYRVDSVVDATGLSIQDIPIEEITIEMDQLSADIINNFLSDI